jgi:hypothetical protein
MEDLANTVADEDFGLDSAEALLERWEGRPDYVLEDIFRVRDLFTKDVIDLELTPYQRQFVHSVWYGEASTVSILKGRRTGYSFIACLTILLKAKVLPHSFFAITGPSKSQAKDRIEDIYDLMEWAKIEFEPVVDNRDEIELPNGATMMAFAGNPDTSRGADSADILFIDEKAFLEDQKESMRAFSPFVALGDAQTIQISTPNTSGDQFMTEMDRGSPAGENGIIAIEQPSFKNAEDIDVEKSLMAQDVEPVNPYQSIEKAEKDRMRDPEGFKQEYLCKTVSDRYRFFTESGISRAIERGKADSYVHHPATHARAGGTMVMGVDIAAGGNDETAIAVFEHAGENRYLRFHTNLSERDLDAAGVGGKPKNPSDMAAYVNFLADNMGVDKVFLDKTGVGEGFNNEVTKQLGRRAQGFDFDDKEEIARMMGDFNYALHNDQITLVENDNGLIKAQLEAIIKEKSHRTSQPKFSGKDNAPDGKDDLAMALVLGAFPPNFDADRKTTPETRKNVSNYESDGPDGSGSPERGAISQAVRSNRTESTKTGMGTVNEPSGVRSGSDRRYKRRHSR